MSSPGSTAPDEADDKADGGSDGTAAAAAACRAGERDDRRQRRVYGGKTATEREATRRQALLDAAFELVGASGYASATVRGICRQAGLSERYFYESFSSRGEILAALYDLHIEEIRDRIIAAVAEVTEDDVAAAAAVGAVHPLITAATRGYVEYCMEDPRRANITVIDATIAGADGEGGLIPSANFSFGRLIEDYAIALLGRPHPRLRECSVGMVGFSSRLLNWWYTSGKSGDSSALVEPITLMFQSMIDRMAAELAAESAVPGTVDSGPVPRTGAAGTTGGSVGNSFASVREHLNRERPSRPHQAPPFA